MSEVVEGDIAHDPSLAEGPRTQPNSQETPAQGSEWEQLRAQLAAKPHDPPGWTRLVDLAEDSGDLEKIKSTYDALLDVYPNQAAAQIAYIDHVIRAEQLRVAENLFKKWLRSSPSVQLWQHYLNYVRRMNTGPGSRDVIRASYEFATKHVGQDKDSGPLWMEYIQFTKAAEPTNTWEEQQKMDSLRKIYHKVVTIPLENVETLWSELEAFENNLNKITAKKFMTDLLPSYVQAKQVLRQLQTFLRPLSPPSAPAHGRMPLDLPSTPNFNPHERMLVGAWKNYLKWEETNPLELEDKDKATLITRIQGVYRKALIRMRFYGEIWYMAYVWTNSVGKEDEALALLKSGIEANPTSFVLNFALAEALELKSKAEDVHEIYKKFLEVLRQELEEVEARVSSANTSLGSQDPTANGGNTSTATNGTANTTGNTTIIDGSFASDERPSKPRELVERRTEFGLVWIMYMRFSRRAEGLKAWRALFKEARKDRWTPWEVYEAAALMEYHCTKEVEVATRIFDMGLKSFGDEVEFALRYLGFLISVNDELNARALFERVIKSFPPDRARPLWERWARYEYQYGDLAAAQNMEKRISEVYPNDPPIKRFAQRHSYLTTDAIASRDLGVAIARQNATSSNGSVSSLARTETQTSFTSAAANTSSVAERKRPSSPDRRRDDGPSATKRQRPLSPPRERERERREGPPARRRYGSPSFDRDREREGSRSRTEREDEKPADKGMVVPPILGWFIGTLPSPGNFDGPVFRTSDLMQVFRDAVIPSSVPRAESPARPPVSRGGGRPPPDYGPYQGPNSNPRGGGRRW